MTHGTRSREHVSRRTLHHIELQRAIPKWVFNRRDLVTHLKAPAVEIKGGVLQELLSEFDSIRRSVRARLTISNLERRLELRNLALEASDTFQNVNSYSLE